MSTVVPHHTSTLHAPAFLATERASGATHTPLYAQFEAIFETVPVGLAVWDRGLRAVRVNRRFAKWHHVAAEEALGRHSSELLAASWGGVRASFGRALRGERFTMDLDRRAAGEERGPAHVSMLYAPVKDEGCVVGVVTCMVDTTQRVEAERALAGAYAQLEAVFDNVPVGIAVFDAGLRAVRMNESMAYWNDLCPRASIGLHASELFPRMWSTIEPHYRQALDGEASEVDLDRRSRGYRSGPAFVSASYVPIRVRGDVVGLTVTSTDVTDRLESERRAQEALRLRDDVMSIVSHELRTPLTSIIGLSEHLERVADAGSQKTLASTRDDIALIRRESERLARLLEVLLDLVGLSGHSGEVDEEPVSLAALVRRQTRMTRERRPGIRLTEEIAAEPIIEADGDRIAQVVSNLVENAAKYAGETAQITVRVRVDDGSACIDVEDDGPGIPIEDQARIFERSVRGEQERQPEGLGLGLYLSRLIAERLGGTLGVVSAPGEGARFTLRLPLAEEATGTLP